MARPKLVIDPQLVHDLAAINCTMEEIAAITKCSVDTLERRFADIIKDGRDIGRSSVRRKQYEVATAGNVTMLIWLGKQLLGQKDKIEQEHSGSVDLYGSILDRIEANESKSK